MKLLIIRHGEPDYSIDSLTEKGWREAALLKNRLEKLPITAFYCSPLGRAKDTAKPTLQVLNRNAEICDWLQEFPAYVIDPVSGNHRIPWDILPVNLAKEPRYYHPTAWLQTELMQSGNVQEKYTAVCTQLDSLLARHGYVHNGSVFYAENPNHSVVASFVNFPSSIMAGFCGVAFFGDNTGYRRTGKGDCVFSLQCLWRSFSFGSR